jgi:hypothetical protein
MAQQDRALRGALVSQALGESAATGALPSALVKPPIPPILTAQADGFGLDLSVPWLAPVLANAEWVRRRLCAGESVAHALSQCAASCTVPPQLAAGPVRFVPQAELPEGAAYEAHIHRTGCVPTRDNLHDFFNGLVWCWQPALKRRLNELQAEAIATQGVAAHRGPLRDALTLMDENGALLSGPEPLLSALRERRWHELFITHRALWAEARFDVFGHALMEKLALAPRKGLTAHVLLARADDCISWPAATWAAKPFLPLPVLAVPGWWPAQDEPGFYDDATVFRPLRAQGHLQPVQATAPGRGTMPV